MSKKKLMYSTSVVDVGCSSCKRLKLSTIFHPKPKYSNKSSPPPPQKRNKYYHHSASTSWDTTTATPTTLFSSAAYQSEEEDEEEEDSRRRSYYSNNNNNYYNNSSFPQRAVQGFGRIGGNSLAVEKDSDDPYLDFRQSMVQMILEKKIYAKEDLKQLLNCFLQLNSPYYHGIIIRAFTEIWNDGFFSKHPPPPPPAAAAFRT